MIRKFFFFSFIVVLVFLVGTSLLFHSKGPEILRATFESRLTSKLKTRVSVDDVRLNWSWPLGLNVDGLTIGKSKDDDFFLEVESTQVSLGLSDILLEKGQFKPSLNLKIKRPKIVFRMKPSVNGQKGNGPHNWPSGTERILSAVPYMNDLALILEVAGGGLELYREKEKLLTTEDLNLKFTMASIHEPSDIELKTKIVPADDAFDYSIPIGLKALVIWKNDKIELIKNELSILSLKSELNATYHTYNEAYELTITSKIDDLVKYPHIVVAFPIRDWAGQLSLDFAARGKWGEKAQLSGNIELKNFSSYLQWGHGNSKVFGNVRGDLRAQLEGVDRLKIRTVDWNLDLTDMTLIYSKLFKKPAKMRMITAGSGETMQDFYFKSVRVDFLNLVWIGQGYMTPQGVSHFSFSAPPFSLQGLEPFLPALSQKPMQGTAELRGEIVSDSKNSKYTQLRIWPLKVQGLDSFVDYKDSNLIINGPLAGNFSFYIDGSLDRQDFLQSPMVTTGQIQARLPQVVYKTVEAPRASLADEGSEKEEVAKVERKAPPSFSFFPKSKLISNLKLTTDLQWAGFTLDEIALKGIAFKSQITKGMMTAHGNIDDVFSGQVVLKKAQIPLTEMNPLIQVNSNFNNINLESFLATVFPQWKNLAFGNFTGDLLASTRLPTSANFLTDLKARGQFGIQQAILNTLPIDHMIKTTLAATPGIGNQKPIFQGPQKMQMQGQYFFENKTLWLRNFVAATPRKEEFILEGKLDLDMNLSLKGTAFLPEAPVLPLYFARNKDAKGRLIVPLTVSGSLVKPDLRLGHVGDQRLGQRPDLISNTRLPAATPPAVKHLKINPRKTSRSPFKKPQKHK